MAWSGPIFVIGFLIACYLAGMFPARLGPTSSVEEVHRWWVDNTLQIRIGAWLGMAFSAFYFSWGGTLAALTRRAERGRPPVLTYVQLGAIGVAVFNAVLVFFWMAFCAYRPDTIDPVLLRSFNDFLWILFEFEDIPLSLWAIAIGLSILLDENEDPVFPRWAAWVNFLFAGLVVTASFMIFFKTGPIAWNGILGLYWPAGVFFTWIMVMSYLMVQAVKKEFQNNELDLIANPGTAVEPASVPEQPSHQ